MSINEDTNRLKNLLVQEVNKIPRPFGIFLSGGIDSAILAALSKPDFAVTCHFPEGEKYDELKYAQIVADYLNIPLKIIRPVRKYFEKHLIKAVKIIGKPINSVSIVPWYLLMAQEGAGKNMVNGEGADELFGGYSRYLILKHIFELYERPELKNYKPTLDFLFKDIHSKLIEKEISRAQSLEEVLFVEFTENLPDILYMEKKLAKHWNVKLYQPFLAIKIIEFAGGLPVEDKIRGWTTKHILRRLASELKLPRKIYRRIDKMGLVCPVNKWMGWTGERGEFDKVKYLNYQKKILGI